MRTRSRLVRRAALPALVAATACVPAPAGGALSPVAEPPVVDEVRGCGTRGDGKRPQRLPSPPGVRIGPLVIWPSVRTRVEAAANGPWRYYVKAPVVLPARARVVLAVAPEGAHLAALQSRRDTLRGVRAIRFEACRASEPAFPRAYRGTVGRYTGFPFGFWLARRSACVPMEVWVEGRDAPVRRRVPFGRASC